MSFGEAAMLTAALLASCGIAATLIVAVWETISDPGKNPIATAFVVVGAIFLMITTIIWLLG